MDLKTGIVIVAVVAIGAYVSYKYVVPPVAAILKLNGQTTRL
jgi:hypothetical protein